jgi:hypothetical protein
LIDCHIDPEFAIFPVVNSVYEGREFSVPPTNYSDMSFTATWNTLLEHLEELPSDATLVTPLSQKAFHVTDVQQHRVLVQYRDDDETIPLQQDQFETLAQRIQDSRGAFELDRLPPSSARESRSRRRSAPSARGVFDATLSVTARR